MEERHWSTGTNGDDGRWSSEDPSDSRRPSSTEEKRTRAALSLSLSLFLFSGRPTEEMLTAMVVDDDEPCPDKEGGFDHVLFLFLPPPSSSTPPSPAPASPAPPPSSLFLSFSYPMRLMTRSKPERGGSHNAAGRLMAAAAAASLRSFKKNERREDTKERTDEYQEEERTVREQEETSIKVGWSGLAWLGALVEFEAVEAGRRRRALRVIWRRSRPLDMSLPNAAAAASNWHQSLSLFLSLSLSLSLSLFILFCFSSRPTLTSSTVYAQFLLEIGLFRFPLFSHRLSGSPQMFIDLLISSSHTLRCPLIRYWALRKIELKFVSIDSFLIFNVSQTSNNDFFSYYNKFQ